MEKHKVNGQTFMENCWLPVEISKQEKCLLCMGSMMAGEKTTHLLHSAQLAVRRPVQKPRATTRSDVCRTGNRKQAGWRAGPHDECDIVAMEPAAALSNLLSIVCGAHPHQDRPSCPLLNFLG